MPLNFTDDSAETVVNEYVSSESGTKADVLHFYVHVYNIEMVELAKILLQIFLHYTEIAHLTWNTFLHHKLNAVFVD